MTGMTPTPGYVLVPEARALIANYIREWALERFNKRIYHSTGEAVADEILAFAARPLPPQGEGKAGAEREGNHPQALTAQGVEAGAGGEENQSISALATRAATSNRPETLDSHPPSGPQTFVQRVAALRTDGEVDAEGEDGGWGIDYAFETLDGLIEEARTVLRIPPSGPDAPLSDGEG